MADDADVISKIQKLLALAGNNPSREEAAAAWAKAQALMAQLKGKPPTDMALKHWYLDNAAPCPWVIKVCTNLVGREYPVVFPVDMLTRHKNTETLPTWRLVDVPLAFRSAHESEILAACYDGRIAWRDPAAPTGGPRFRYAQAIP